MGKGVKIALVCMEFAAFTAGGYFIGEQFLSDIVITKVDGSAEAMPVEQAPIEEVVVLSPVPVLVPESVSRPVLGKDDMYSFDVVATVENGDTLEYVLFADDKLEKEFSVNNDGKFTGVPPLTSQKYYVCARNASTGDYSDVIIVEGFVKPEPKLQKYTKITTAELNDIFNIKKSYEAAEKGFSHRLAPGYKIIVNGINEGERIPVKIDEICSKIQFGQWNSVTIGNISYDGQNRLTKLVITVNY